MLQQEGIGLIYKIKYTTRSLNPRGDCCFDVKEIRT